MSSVLLAQYYYIVFSCVAPMPLPPAQGRWRTPYAFAGNTIREARRKRLMDRLAFHFWYL
jgi:hypothetical protein